MTPTDREAVNRVWLEAHRLGEPELTAFAGRMKEQREVFHCLQYFS
ncbi:MAG: hypothetical protein ACLP7P_10070 [Rhodomicrobium sp.]